MKNKGYLGMDTPAWYDWSERAAIREFEGGYTRGEAERLASLDLFGTDLDNEPQRTRCP
jgi:hypothetical protein